MNVIDAVYKRRAVKHFDDKHSLTEAEAAACKAKKAIQTAFENKLFDKHSGEWKNIELRYCDVISEEALTYRQFSLMKPWRLEHISLGADQHQPMLTE